MTTCLHPKYDTCILIVNKVSQSDSGPTTQTEWMGVQVE